MAAVDTLKVTKRLAAAGAAAPLAEAIAEVLAEGSAAPGLSHLATREDLMKLKADLLQWIIALIFGAVLVNVGAMVALVKITAPPVAAATATPAAP